MRFVNSSDKSSRSVMPTLWPIMWRLAGFLVGSTGLHAAPTIIQGPSDTTTFGGDSAVFRVTATGVEPLTYQWQRNGVAIPGATARTCTIGPATRAHIDYYNVVITDASGSTASANVRLTVATGRSSTVVPDSAWKLDLETDVDIDAAKALVAIPGGGFYAAGEFVSINGMRRCRVARINPDGSVNALFVPPEMNGPVVKLALQRDGKIVVGGSFTRIGTHLRAGIARLNADGSVDPAFAPVPAAPTVVSALAAEEGGRVIAAFSGRAFLVRYNADGSRDAAYNPSTNGAIYALAVQPDGKLIVGGFFANVDNVNRRSVARLLPDGSLDRGFEGPSSSKTFRAIALYPDGRIVLAGEDLTANPGLRENVTRLTPIGVLDTGFSPPANSNTGILQAVAIDATERIVVAGRTSSGAGIFVRLQTNGAIDTSFRPPTNLGAVSAMAMDLTSGTNQRILAGAVFSRNSTTPLTGLLAVNGDGSVDSRDLILREPGIVRAIAPLPGGKFLIGGRFSFLRNVAVPSGLVRVNVDGTLDPSFNRQRAGAATGTDGYVSALAPLPDGRIAVGGSFTAFNGTNARNLILLRAEGDVDSSFASTAGTDGSISTIAVMPRGRLAVGGTFTTFASVPRGNLAVVTLSGSLDPAFVQTSNGFGGAVHALALQRDGGLLVGGRFTRYGNTTTVGLARLNDDGSLDANFHRAMGAEAGGFDRTVYAITVLQSDNIMIGGDFRIFNRQSANGIVRLIRAGARDPEFANTLLPSLQVYALVNVFEENGVVARGVSPNFVSFGAGGDTLAIAAGGFEDLSSEGSLILRDDGELIGTSSPSGQGVFATTASARPSLLTQPADQQVVRGGSATFSVVPAALPLPVSYQWSFNGQAIAGATSSSYTVNNVRLAHAGTYTVTVTSELGSVTSRAAVLSGASLSRILNVATRASHAPGDRALIAGFVISGTDPKAVVVRAVGPALTGFGVTGALTNPTLQIVRGSTVVTTNDDWGSQLAGGSSATAVSAAFTRVGAFPLPSGGRDAAVLVNLTPGTYSVVVGSVGEASGAAIVEVYDASDPLAESAVINLSTRAEINAAAPTLIAGVVIDGSQPKDVLIRAAGPALAGFGVANALADPQFQLYRGETLIATNDNWDADVTQGAAAASAAQRAGAFALRAGSRDAALVRQLQPGAYTVHVSGVGGAVGVSLVEIYQVP